MVWTIDGETMATAHSAQNVALERAFAPTWVRSGDWPTFEPDISAPFRLVQQKADAGLVPFRISKCPNLNGSR